MVKLEDFSAWKFVLVAEIVPSCANIPGYNTLYLVNNSPLFLDYFEHFFVFLVTMSMLIAGAL